MNLKRLFCTLIILFSANISYSFADNDTACQAVLCLSGGLANEKGFQECIAPITTYANIRVYDHKKFNETLTALARDRFLKQCSTADTSFINRISLTYGRLEDVKL